MRSSPHACGRHLLLGVAFDAVALPLPASTTNSSLSPIPGSRFGVNPTSILYPAVFLTSLGTLLVVWVWQKRGGGGGGGSGGGGVGENGKDSGIEDEDVSFLHLKVASGDEDVVEAAERRSGISSQQQGQDHEQEHEHDEHEQEQRGNQGRSSFLDALRGQVSVLLHSPGALLLSLDVLLLNACTTVVEGLCFLYFSSLGASYTLMGVSVAITVRSLERRKRESYGLG